jgi:flagella basal body P-ring formation protein FlgA
MAGPKRLSPRVVRAIFRSTEPAAATAKRYKVSPNLVYLIRGRRIHKATTIGLKSPQLTRREGRRQQAAPRLDVDRLADAISKKVVRDLVDRLRGKG